MGNFAEVGDASEEVDQRRTNRRPGGNPLQHMNESCRIAAQLTGTNVAEIERIVTACRELVENLQAEACAGRHQADLAFGIDHDEIETVGEFKLHLGIGIGAAMNEIGEARLPDHGIIVDGEPHIASDP